MLYFSCTEALNYTGGAVGFEDKLYILHLTECERH